MIRPGDNISLADIGRNYQAKPRRPERAAAVPSFTEARDIHTWDALSAEAKARIKAGAKDAAAKAMADWSARRG